MDIKASISSSHLVVEHSYQFTERDTLNEVGDCLLQIIRTTRIVFSGCIFQCTPQVKIRGCKISVAKYCGKLLSPNSKRRSAMDACAVSAVAQCCWKQTRVQNHITIELCVDSVLKEYGTNYPPSWYCPSYFKLLIMQWCLLNGMTVNCRPHGYFGRSLTHINETRLYRWKTWRPKCLHHSLLLSPETSGNIAHASRGHILSVHALKLFCMDASEGAS
jgi:hypothetical protein